MSFYEGTKIQRILLKNFIGIHAGLGLEELEIDLSVSNHRNILLLGGNGSGKSTILSTLHPFRESFDDRNELIIDGKVGRKEIDILQDGVLYKIIHEYGSKNKSLITKIIPGEDPVELNPAGTIRSFVTIVEEELGLEPSFFNLIKIGSQSQNFIDLKSSQRKEFIGNFTPNIDEYLDAFTVVKNKYSISNKEIKFVSDELDKLKEPEVIKKSIKVLKSTEKSLQSDISDLNSQKKYNETLLEDTDTLEEMSTLESEISQLSENTQDIQSKLNELREEYGQSFDSIKDIEESIAKKEKTKEKRIEELNKLKIKEAQAGQELKSTQVQIKKLDDDIKKITNPSDQSIESLKESIEKETKNFNKLLTKLDIDATLESFKPFGSQYEKMENYNYALSFTRYTLPNILNDRVVNIFDEYLMNKDRYSLDKWLDTWHKKTSASLKSAKETKQEYETKVSTIQKDLDIAEMVTEYIPLCAKQEDCCLYERLGNDSDKVEKDEELIEELNESIENVSGEIYFFTEKLHNIESTQVLLQYISSKLTELGNGVKEYLLGIYKANTSTEYDTLRDIILFSKASELDKLDRFIKADIDKIKEYNLLDTSYHNIEKYTNQLNSYSDSTSTIKVLEENKEELLTLIGPLQIKYNELTQSITDKKEKLELADTVLVIYHKVLNLLKQEDTITKDLAKLEKDYSRLTKINKNLLEAKESLPKIEKLLVIKQNELEDIQEELSNERLELSRFNEYTKRKEKLTNERKILSVLKEALDVKTGIPLVLVGDYLDSIRNTCNRLLSIAYKGKFYIDFEISDKDFFISVFKNGVKTATDINACSQGETAMVKTSLSLGIISQAISNLSKQYNVVYLDEVDAELDQQNRLLFLDILEEQLDILNSSQCFVISHNDSFFSAEAGLILLNGHKVDTSDEEFMENKTVIYEV